MASLDRPDVETLSNAYNSLFKSSVPIAKLKDAAFGGRLFKNDQEGVPGRSMSWKLFMIPAEPLSPPASSTPPKVPLPPIRELRNTYVALLKEKMRAPDGNYEVGLSIPGIPSLPTRTHDRNSNLEKNNPLSLHEDTPWKAWFASVELRRVIRQDVERTFPDIAYFRDSEVQAQLTTILYVHSLMNPDIGYRQGMHELLAPIYFAMDYDSAPGDGDCDEEMREYCSRMWVAADAWAFFTIVMQGVGVWYEWREAHPPELSPTLKSQFRHGAPEGQVDLKPYVAPIVHTCQKLQGELLRATDPVLWQSMQLAGIEPQIYGIRWLRLLFTREFPLRDAMVLWDGLFTCDMPFELVPWICVAMLIRIRNTLISSDYSGQLTTLLRYPPPPKEIDASCPHHANLLLRQALALQISSTTATGASIVIENRNLLGIPVEAPEPVTPSHARRRPAERPKNYSVSHQGLSAFGGVSSNGNQQLRHGKERSGSESQTIALPDFARGLLEKGESLGINRTVMNAVSEIRKNLPDLPNRLVRSPPAVSDSYSSFPMLNERPPEERPPWEPKTRFEMEREVTSMRSLHKMLGDAVGVAVDALLQDEGDNQDEDRVKAIRNRKREAIESLAYVRDVLKDTVEDVDEERLFGETEYHARLDRKARISAETDRTSSEYGHNLERAPPAPPKPAAAIATSTEDRRASESFSSGSAFAVPPKPIIPGPTAPDRLSTSRRQSTVQKMGPCFNTPSAVAPGLVSPWNYTPSNFSQTATDNLSLPRPPPRTTTRTPPDQTPRHRNASPDPLGVLH